jgi:glycosyltransferase involved in cell wall biosynthesis
MSKHPISVSIIARDEERRLSKCLESVRFSDDVVVVVDSRSTDRTAEIAREYGCRVYIEDWRGSGPQKQSAIDKCRNQWVLLLDADERLSPGSEEAVLRAVQNPSVDAYMLNRKAYIAKRWIKHSDWWPDWLIRLFKKERCRVDGIYHPKIMVSGNSARLHAEIDHYSFFDYAHMVSKINRFSDWTAGVMHDEGKRVSVISPITHAAWMFFKVYFLKRGFLDGLDGLVIAVYSATKSFFKYAKLLELQRKKCQG